MVLGDLGADVIRVDRIEEVDQTEFVDRVVRRSQRSIAVDVKDARGAELVRTLVTGADAFVDVFRPGALERIGLGPDDLLARNARLIYARMTGYGQDGPLAPMAGHDINYLAMSGALHAIGTADLPLPPLNLVGDYGGGGMLLAVGLLSGILEARQSGKGQVVDVAMVDGVVTLMTPFYGLGRRPVGGSPLRQRARRRSPLLPRVRDLRWRPHRGRSDGAAVLRRADPQDGGRRAPG
jgi:alpha-methylacyl-CoA racemase